MTESASDAGNPPEIIDLKPGERERLRVDVLRGLRDRPKWLPSKYLYDDEGSRLFDEITGLPEYYPTRTEAAIFEERAAEIAGLIGPKAAIIEPGGGNGEKAAWLVDALDSPVAVMPIDISMDYVERSAEALAARFPNLEIIPVCGDFTHPMDTPDLSDRAERRLVFFPGSTVGNFPPEPRAELLRSLASLAGAGGSAIIGVDLRKERETLEAAYDDAAGVTAAFNFNYLERLNRELDADFDAGKFTYLAEWNDDEGAVEMFLVSRREQTVVVAGEPIRFGEGERLHTESSYKFRVAEFEREAATCGLRLDRVWTDDRDYFSVMLFRVAG